MSVSRNCKQELYQGNTRCRKRQEHHAQVLDFVARASICARKLHYLLHTQTDKRLNIGLERLFNLLDEYRILVPVKLVYHKTTNSHHHFYRHPNQLKVGQEQITTLETEQIWVADITYLPLLRGMVYLSLVTNGCSRKIGGYHVEENLQTENLVKEFRQALRRKKTTAPMVHHSNRGLQYCSAPYQSVHKSNGITCSMADGYD